MTLCRAASGKVETVSKEDLPHTYRSVEVPPGDVILAALFTLTPQSREEIRNTMHHLKATRADTQPLALPNAGCIFKNPSDASAGQLIDEAGLKGKHIGGAEVSDVHANFIVNTGDARAADVLALMELVHTRVMDTHGVSLEPEIRVVGVDE